MRKLLCLASTCLIIVSAFLGCDSKTPFSQQEYDECFVSAFALNTEFGRAYVDYKPEFWSKQKGFDDGVRAFKQLYKIEKYDPVNYDVSLHIHEIISRAKEDDSVLTKPQKQDVLDALTKIEKRSKPPDNDG